MEAIACTQDHFQAYMVLYEYGNGNLKKADAKEMLKVNIDGWGNYAAHNRDVIADILKEDEQPMEAFLSLSSPLRQNPNRLPYRRLKRLYIATDSRRRLRIADSTSTRNNVKSLEWECFTISVVLIFCS